jgi:tetratricopeptide (TPR) repeat protein
MDTFEQAMTKARDNFGENKFKEASKYYFEAIQAADTDEDRAIAWAEQSWLFYQTQNFEGAINSIDNVLKFNPEYEAKEQLYRILGFAYLGLTDDEMALQNLEKSLQIDHSSPDQQIVIYEIAKIRFKKQDYEAAYNLLDEIESYFYQQNQDYWLSILFYKGFIHYYNNKFIESESIFEELLENSKDAPRKATGLFGLAFVAFGKKDYLKTINLCESLVKLDENFFDMETVGFLTAASFYYLGRYDIFEQYYHQLKKRFPTGRYQNELKQLAKVVKDKSNDGKNN